MSTPISVNEFKRLKNVLTSQKKIIKKQNRELFNLRLQLVEEKKEHTELYDFNASCYFTLNENYLIQQVNFRGALLVGIDRQFLTDKSFLNCLASNSKNIFRKTIQTLLDKKLKQTCEIQILQKGGSRKQVHVESTLLKNQLIRLCLIDMTSTQQLLKKTEELEKSLNFVNNLFQHASDAIAALDSELHIKIINQSFIKLFSTIFAIRIQVGMNISMLLADFPDLKMKIILACHQATLGNQTAILLENLSNNNEVYYCYELVIHSLFNPYTQENELIFHIKNLTEHQFEENRKHKQQADIALAFRRSAMKEMAAAFAHEISQPLTAIFAYSQGCLYLLNNNPNNKNQLSFPLQQIALQSDQARKIIDNMQNFIHDNDFHIKKTDINLLIRETLAILNYELLDFKLKITLNLNEDLPKVKVNKIHIMQIILNLARNSIEALQSVSTIRPELKIETRELDDHIVVDFIDNGPGIPPEFENRIINPYFTTKPQPTGIGLGICQSLIKVHGGKLNMQKHPEKGAWFTFTLPLNPNRPLSKLAGSSEVRRETKLPNAST